MYVRVLGGFGLPTLCLLLLFVWAVVNERRFQRNARAALTAAGLALARDAAWLRSRPGNDELFRARLLSPEVVLFFDGIAKYYSDLHDVRPVSRRYVTQGLLRQLFPGQAEEMMEMLRHQTSRDLNQPDMANGYRAAAQLEKGSQQLAGLLPIGLRDDAEED
jgi:hypothetical protein